MRVQLQGSAQSEVELQLGKLNFLYLLLNDNITVSESVVT